MSANENIKQVDNEVRGCRGTGTKGDGTSVIPPSFLYGVKISPQFGDITEVERTIKEVSEMGAKDAIIEIVWSLIETPQNDNYTWSRWDSIMSYAKTYGINVWAQVTYTPNWSNALGPGYPPKNPQDYADFVSVVMSRYKDQIKGVEIWNEPNLKHFWEGSVAQYVEMLNLAYDAVKSVEEDIVVISGGLSSDNADWIDTFLSSNPKPKFDWFGYHPYAKYYSPAESSISQYHGIPNLKNVKAKLESCRFNNNPILITEFGYSATTAPAGGKVPSWEQVGIYVPESFAVAQTMNYTKGLFYFHYRGSAVTDYGLVDTNWNNRTGYYAYSNMMKILPHYIFEKQISGTVDQSGAWVLKFKSVSNENSKLWFMFSPYINNNVVEPQEINVNIGNISGVLTNLTGTQEIVYPDENGNIKINVTSSPYYLEAKEELPPLYFTYSIHVEPPPGTGPGINSTTFNIIRNTINEIASTLDKHSAKGTFLIIPEVARTAKEYEGATNNTFLNLTSRGHEIGLHTHWSAEFNESNVYALKEIGIEAKTWGGKASEGTDVNGAHKLAEKAGFEISFVNVGLTGLVGDVGDPDNTPENYNKTHNHMIPWRPNYPEDKFEENNPYGKIIHIDHVGPDWMNYDKVHIADNNSFKNLSGYFEAALGIVHPGKVNTWGFVTHPNEYLQDWNGNEYKYATGLVNSSRIKALDNFLSEVDPYVKEGKVIYATAREVAKIYEEQEINPIYINYIMHFDPVPTTAGGNIEKSKWERFSRETMAWLAGYFDALEKNVGKDFAPKVTFELAGDHAEWYNEDQIGLTIMENFYKKNHAFGVHFHVNYKAGPHYWPTAPESMSWTEITEDHVNEVDALLSKVINSTDPSALRNVNHILTGQKVDYAWGLSKGFDTRTGGLYTELLNLFFDHDPYNPYRIGTDETAWGLSEVPDGEWVITPIPTTLGMIHEHGGAIPPDVDPNYTVGQKWVWQDTSVPAMKRKFLALYLEWRENEKRGNKKIWVFGWHHHPHQLVGEDNAYGNASFFRDELKEMVNWLNENFIGKVARYASTEESRQKFIDWEKENPGKSSFNYPVKTRDWDVYPYLLKGLANELMYSHYDKEIMGFGDVKVHKLLRTEGRNWTFSRDGEIVSSAPTEEIYLIWSENGEKIIDFSSIVRGQLKCFDGYEVDKYTIQSSTKLQINETPIVCIPTFVTLPDLSISKTEIIFSNPSPIEGEKVYINATIHIVDLTVSANITVKLLVDNILQSTRNITITSGLNNVVVSFLLTAVKGTHNISIKVDAADIVKELNETNNIATKSIMVGEKPSLPKRGEEGISKEFPWFYTGAGLVIIIAVIAALIIFLRKKKTRDSQ
ncbi:MAG: CARDB domain-containing protein [Candidatus Thermoplasmatota archaeon]